MNDFGEMVRKARLKLSLSLREFCQLHGYDAGNWSRLENGRSLPSLLPLYLTQMAERLKIPPSKRQLFYDTAYAVNGMIPPDLMENAEFVESLPVLFAAERQSRNKKT